MKKILKSMIAVVLLVCCAITVSACSCSKEPGMYSAIFVSDNNSADSIGTKLSQATSNEFLDAARPIVNEPTKIPNLQTGIKIIQTNKTTTSNYTIENFAMLVRETDGEIIAEGKFDMIVTIIGTEQKAHVKFYHDGTYLGMEITQEGLDGVDKQKEVLPITSLNNYFGDSEMIEKILSTDLDEEMFDTLEDYLDEELTDIYNVTKGTNKKGGFVTYSVNATVDGQSSGLEIAFDNNGNCYGYKTFVRANGEYSKTFEFEKITYKGDINMPSDFNSWTVRNP